MPIDFADALKAGVFLAQNASFGKASKGCGPSFKGVATEARSAVDGKLVAADIIGKLGPYVRKWQSEEMVTEDL